LSNVVDKISQNFYYLKIHFKKIDMARLLNLESDKKFIEKIAPSNFVCARQVIRADIVFAQQSEPHAFLD